MRRISKKTIPWRISHWGADWILALNRPIQPDSLGLAVLDSRRVRQRDWNIATAANLACSVLICMSHRFMSSVLLGQL
jgi:hypothetical protein